MIDRRDPEARVQRESAVLLQRENWRAGLIGDATLVRSLMILGYGDRDAVTELRMMKMNRKEVCKNPDCERGGWCERCIPCRR